MQPETGGVEEQGPSRVPFINDPKKPASKSTNENDEPVDSEEVDDADEADEE